MAIKIKLRNKGIMAMFNALPNDCSRELSAVDTISFWINRTSNATIANSAKVPARATVVTVLTVDVVTVEIISYFTLPITETQPIC